MTLAFSQATLEGHAAGYSDGGYFDETNVHPVGVVALALLGLAVLLLPRRWALTPFLVMACAVPPAQRFALATLDFHFLRLLILAGWLRVFLRGESRDSRLKRIDLALLAWSLWGALAYVLLWDGSTGAIVYKLGRVMDAVGLYFLGRVLIRERADLERLISSIVVLSVPVALAFLVERATTHNPFAFLGGVPERTAAREGRLRCVGPFVHPIMAGCFWAVLLPLMFTRLWRPGASRWLTWVGLASALVIVSTTASSTPLGAVLVAALGGLLFLVRGHLRILRWGTLFTLVGLHLVMNKPVWHLLARINLVGGSTGWHRYYLIDQAIAHLQEWWLVGTRSTQHWGRGLGDVTNQYVLEGVQGGLLSLLLFLLLAWLAFQRVGMLLRAAAGEPRATALAWGLGVALGVHCANFIAVSYFGQMNILWYLSLAAIGSLPLPHSSAARGREPNRSQDMRLDSPRLRPSRT